MDELKIEIPHREDLLDLQQFLLSNLMDEIEIQEINEISSGFNREPLLIALVIALGGPVVTKQVVGLLNEWIKLKHEEKMVKLSILSKNGKRTVTLDDLQRI